MADGGLTGSIRNIVSVPDLRKRLLPVKLTVQAHHFSESARTKIEQAGGSVEVLG